MITVFSLIAVLFAPIAWIDAVVQENFRWCGQIIVGTIVYEGAIEFLGCGNENTEGLVYSLLSFPDAEGRYRFPQREDDYKILGNIQDLYLKLRIKGPPVLYWVKDNREHAEVLKPVYVTDLPEREVLRYVFPLDEEDEGMIPFRPVFQKEGTYVGSGTVWSFYSLGSQLMFNIPVR
ncbi:MAG TPA: hypothetical protein VJA22_00660 [Patescibacteria group bacterium]|nr:hypothetical protein [Patescibacteria group bacterium]